MKIAFKTYIQTNPSLVSAYSDLKEELYKYNAYLNKTSKEGEYGNVFTPFLFEVERVCHFNLCCT